MLRLIVVYGPSGTGKSTLIQRMIETYPDKFAKPVSYTTRSRREDEKEGSDYFFVNETEFKNVLTRGAFTEHAYYNGHLYGTRKAHLVQILRKGLTPIIEISAQGVKLLKKFPHVGSIRYVFVKPPSLLMLEARLRGQETYKDDEIEARLDVARAEIQYGERAINSNLVLHNDDLELAFQKLSAFALQ